MRNKNLKSSDTEVVRSFTFRARAKDATNLDDIRRATGIKYDIEILRIALAEKADRERRKAQKVAAS